MLRSNSRSTTAMTGLAAAAISLSMSLAAPEARAQTFKGQTISILVGYTAGGGTDAAARLIASHIDRHIPGAPNVIVRNMPGGGGIRAHNYAFERARPDGGTLLYAPSAIQSQLLGEPGVRFDYTKFALIAPFQTPPSVIYARNDAVPGGLQSPADIVKAPKLVFAGLRPTSSLAIWSIASLNLLGVDFRFVPGYRGTAQMVQAVAAGEANISTTSLQGIRSTVEPALLAEKAGQLLWYFPYKDESGEWRPSPEAKGIASFLDVYKQVHNRDPEGAEWERFNYWADVFSLASTFLLAPPGLDDAITAELRAAAVKLVEDPDFIAAQEKTFGFSVTLSPAEKISARMKEIVEADSPHLAFWKAHLQKLAQ